MRLDASYNLCSQLGSKLIFGRNYGNFSFTRPFSDFDGIFRIVILLQVGPDRIYANSSRSRLLVTLFTTSRADPHTHAYGPHIDFLS